MHKLKLIQREVNNQSWQLIKYKRKLTSNWPNSLYAWPLRYRALTFFASYSNTWSNENKLFNKALLARKETDKNN